MLFAGAHVLGAHVHDAVGVDVEGDLNLGHAARCGWNTNELELTQRDVVLGKFALALQDVDFHRRLVVRGRGVDFGTSCGNGGVSLDHRGHHATEGLNAQGEGRDVEEQDVRNAFVASDDTRLECSTHGHRFVGVDALVGRFAGFLLNSVLNGRNTCGATDQNDLVDIALLQTGVLHGLTRWHHRLLDEFGDEVLKLGSGEREVHVNRLAVGHGDERQVDLGLLGA